MFSKLHRDLRKCYYELRKGPPSGICEVGVMPFGGTCSRSIIPRVCFLCHGRFSYSVGPHDS
jgi:hypothetical protein